tara:strand:- start:37425 stop:38399 length:975 start_codon:yes stop_codon:yes gene_type:complete
MNKKLIFLWLSTLLIAFFIGRAAQNHQSDSLTSLSTENSELNSKTSKYDKITQQIQSLSMNELKEYENLKENKAKYNKAKEIYEKVFKMLLLNLGAQYLNAGITLPTYEKIEEDISQKIRDEIKDEIKAELSQASAPEIKQDDSSQQELYERPNNNGEQNNVNEEPKKFANGIHIKNPNNFRSKAKIIKKKSKLLENFIGSYYGKILLFKSFANKSKNKEDTWNVSIEANFIFQKEKGYLGNSVIELSSPEKGIFSRSNGTGTNAAFLKNKNFKNALVITASPSIFFAIRYSKRKQSWVGDVFKLDNSNPQYKQIGIITGLFKN